MMATFDELAAIQAGRKRPTKTIEVEFGGQVIALEFQEINGDKWAEITVRHPMRDDVILDQNCGYNTTTASREAAKLSGARVDGGTREELSPSQWETLLGADGTDKTPEKPAALDGNDFRRVVDAIWVLNEWEPIQRRDALKKASKPAGPSRRKRS